ncbi:MAG TPA: FAD-dependent oxidoreductase [Thermomicrobiales bacterium]|nr:FAD-dependent oxidoreductase [Thermomicrobiales bacterium]
MQHVTIVGGGVIGLSTAWELRQRGAEVTVLDAREPGTAASAVNAGWVSPSLAGPVPAPGLIQQSFKWMLDPASPLYIRPRLEPSFLVWLYRFWRSCNESKYMPALEATARLGQETLADMDRWVSQGVEFEMHDYGLLFAFRDLDEMEKELKAFETVIPYGFERPTPWLGDDLREQEPVFGKEVLGGYMVKEERTVQPVSLVKGLINALEKSGVELRAGSPVVDIDVSGGRVVAVRTPTERIETQHVMIAAGAWTRQVAKLAGAKVPIEPGKGYGLDFRPKPVSPRSSLYLHEDRVAVSPFDGGLRLSGTMELSGITERFTQRRINAIHKAGQKLLNGFPQDAKPAHVWTGMRPMAPDGIPVLGKVSGFSNLTVATGHAMLGVTLAAVTGVNMAELITTGKTPDILKPFDPARFNGILL